MGCLQSGNNIITLSIAESTPCSHLVHHRVVATVILQSIFLCCNFVIVLSPMERPRNPDKRLICRFLIAPIPSNNCNIYIRVISDTINPWKWNLSNRKSRKCIVWGCITKRATGIELDTFLLTQNFQRRTHVSLVMHYRHDRNDLEHLTFIISVVYFKYSGGANYYKPLGQIAPSFQILYAPCFHLYVCHQLPKSISSSSDCSSVANTISWQYYYHLSASHL